MHNHTLIVYSARSLAPSERWKIKLFVTCLKLELLEAKNAPGRRKKALLVSFLTATWKAGVDPARSDPWSAAPVAAGSVHAPFWRVGIMIEVVDLWLEAKKKSFFLGLDIDVDFSRAK